jgi:guanosine-3',5'-bis(diphosphate) 3'-pyrophosphohydrolase
MNQNITGIDRILRAVKFSADQHRYQRRKGADATPYINHPIEVAETLCRVGSVDDVDILIAAILHDTIEDTGATGEQIEVMFGARVRGFVEEVTDDKSLPKKERKQKQVEHAPHLSDGAKQIKLCDKSSNIKEIMNDPPADWSLTRKLEYLDWGERVVAGLRGVNKNLEDYFDEILKQSRKKLTSED